MIHDEWVAVDNYLASLYPDDTALETGLKRAAEAGLPDIQISPAQGQFLHVLARSLNASSILEIGTLGGYSAICMARALPTAGRLVTLESDPAHAAVARDNIAAAGLDDRATVVVGPALETLPAVASQFPGGFDLIFIDADKEAYPAYWDWSLRVAHPGTMIVADNVIRDGRVADPDDDDPQVVGVRQYLALATSDARVVTAVVPTVGVKGYDGLSYSLVVRTHGEPEV